VVFVAPLLATDDSIGSILILRFVRRGGTGGSVEFPLSAIEKDLGF